MPWTSAHAREKQPPSQAPLHTSPCYTCYVHYAIDFSQQPYEEVLRFVPSYR